MRDATAVPVVASTGLAEVLAGPERSGRVVGATAAAAYVLVSPTLDHAPSPAMVALEAAGAVGLPCGLGLTAPAPASLPGGLPVGAPVRIAGGRLHVAGHVLAVARWRRARPRLRSVTAQALAAGVGAAASRVPDETDPLAVRVAGLGDDLAAAVAAGDLPAARGFVDALCGLGEGSTPSGDDVVAGLVAGGALLAAVTTGADGPGADVFGRLGAYAAGVAPGRTPALSAALLAHAARAEVASPVADLLHALTGRGDLDRAMRRLRRVGHRSGTDLARGVLLAAGVVAGTHVAPRPARVPEVAHA
ncbi:MAG: DUF2877 domain-containing protein [Acidimicrobiales bacterium]|nr:DUF2877 domain-containing protein [Acidimicrobiales bacterium]